MRQTETARLILRAPLESDTEALLAIRNSGFVQRYNAMEIVGAERLRRQIEKDIENGTAIHLVRKADNRLIGGIWMAEDDVRYDVKVRSLSYYLAEEYARQGYMKEALGAVIDALFREDPALELVSARVFRGNAASERLLLSLGFTYEGCIRRCVRDKRGVVHDDMQFSLLREEWRPKT